MPEPTRINLTYNGPEVHDGTMPIGLVADALDGFSASYRKIASYLDESVPELRLAAPEKGSFDLIVVAAGTLGQNPQLIATGLEYAKRIGHLLAKFIDLKKMLRGETYQIQITGDNNTVNIVRADNITIPTTKEILEIYEAKLIDRDVSKIVRPLRPKRIDSAELKLDGQSEVVVTSDDKKYFEGASSGTTTTKPDELVGSLVSNNKEKKRGTFRMEGGRTVPYHYVGADVDDFLRDFSYRGAVRVNGEVKTDEAHPSLNPISDASSKRTFRRRRRELKTSSWVSPEPEGAPFLSRGLCETGRGF